MTGHVLEVLVVPEERGGAEPKPPRAGLVSGGLFSVLGAAAGVSFDLSLNISNKFGVADGAVMGKWDMRGSQP